MITHTSTIIAVNKLAKKIKKFSEINAHNEAVLELAKFMEDKDAIATMEDLIVKRKEAGGMDSAWITQRYQLMQVLLVEVLLKYGIEVRNKLGSSF